MPITRTYECDCGHRFEMFHRSSAETAGACPACGVGATVTVPGRFAIATNVSKAGDYTYAMLEREQDVTDIRDNQRVGDTSVLAHRSDPKIAQDRARFVAEMREAAAQTGNAPTTGLAEAPTWTGGAGQAGGGVFAPGITDGASYAKRNGLDAVSLAQSAPGGDGPVGMKLKIVGAADVKS